MEEGDTTISTSYSSASNAVVDEAKNLLMTISKYSKDNSLNNYEDLHTDHTDEKVEKSRERNREHAKRTRLRKKALIEGMKGKLLELQKDAAKLQQLFEESNTANILLCLSTKSDPSHLDAIKRSASDVSLYSATDELLKQSDYCKSDNPSFVRGNIIEQLRSRVRAEAAQQLLVNAARSKPHGSNVTSTPKSLSVPTTTPLGLQMPGLTSDYNVHSIGSDSLEIDFNSTVDSSNLMADKLPMDLDDVESDDGEEFETMQPVAEGVVNWKNGTMVLAEGSVRKLSPKEIEMYRKERNRIHAKLTRDRKKLFTSRMQQMINSLERQNNSMRSRLKALAQIGNSMTTDFQDNREINL